MTPERDDEYTGKDIPKSDGTVSDEDMNSVSGETDDKPTGQDHSLENYAETMPRDGVGAIQDSSLIKENVANIEDEE